MGTDSAIQWTDHTFNPWIGCTKVSLGEQGACEHCYAESSTPSRAMHIEWGSGKPRHLTSEGTWHLPRRWERNAAGFHNMHGRRQRVFCASLADVFDNEVDPRWRADLFRLIRETPSLDWLLLTKRIGNAAEMIDRALTDGHLRTSREPFWPWPNVWLGATVANQEEADRDVPKLLRTPARVRFLSCEPLLGPIDLLGNFKWCPTHDFAGGFCIQDCGAWQRVAWVIVGGESGSKARPFVLGHAKDVVRQCRAAGVAVFMKQAGANPVNREGERCPHIKHPKGADMAEWPAELRVREFPRSAT